MIYANNSRNLNAINLPSTYSIELERENCGKVALAVACFFLTLGIGFFVKAYLEKKQFREALENTDVEKAKNLLSWNVCIAEAHISPDFVQKLQNEGKFDSLRFLDKLLHTRGQYFVERPHVGFYINIFPPRPSIVNQLGQIPEIQQARKIAKLEYLVSQKPAARATHTHEIGWIFPASLKK
ncbi:MAG: hypothetical protein JSS32_03390 [Verrucomicrobia bacterium]|nr:hypothetical protein [Verrucomicrobiota bacterium]